MWLKSALVYKYKQLWENVLLPVRLCPQGEQGSRKQPPLNGSSYQVMGIRQEKCLYLGLRKAL